MTGKRATTSQPQDVVVIVTGSASPKIDILVEAIRNRDLSPVLLVGNINAEDAHRVGAFVDRMGYVDDPYDPQLLADAARDLAGGTPGAIVSWYDGTIVPTAQAAVLLGLGRTPVDGLARARNKYATRRVLGAAGLATPPYALISSADQASAIARTVGLPLIIKPVNGSGSNLVRRVDTVAELEAAYRTLAVHVPKAMGGMYATPIMDPDGEPIDASRSFLVEGLLRGCEYSADVVIRDGKVERVLLLDKFLVDEGFFERGFTWPPLNVSEDRQELMWRVVEEALTALGVDNTVAHVEVLDDVTAGPTIVEVNAGRPGGQIIGLLAAVATGVDLRDEHLALLVGAPARPRRAPTLPPPLATLTIFNESSGRLIAVHGLSELAEHPEVFTVVTAYQPGDVISDEYEAFPVNVLVAGLETLEELVDVYKEISQLVRFEIAPIHPVDR
jgi:biotin carboxylase